MELIFGHLRSGSEEKSGSNCPRTKVRFRDERSDRLIILYQFKILRDGCQTERGRKIYVPPKIGKFEQIAKLEKQKLQKITHF